MKFSDSVKISVCSLRKEGIFGLRNIISAYFNLQSEPLRMSSEPLIIQIEPTLHCNLKCQMCVNPLHQREERHMRLDEFKRILDDMPLIKKISLVGAGEPLMNPELFNMISYANAKGILIGFATNGMLLNEENCRKIVDNRTRWVNISMDSANKQTFEAIRKGANFNLILEGIKRLVKIRGRKLLPDISLWFVLLEENLSELPRVIELAKDLGVRNVFAQLEHHWSNDQLKKNMAYRNSRDFLEKLSNTLKDAKISASKSGVFFSYVNIPDTKGRRECKWPWKSCYISAEGFVTPCCLQGANPQIINFGNIFKEGFRAIWNNVSYQNFRRTLKSSVPPDICIDCSSYYQKIRL